MNNTYELDSKWHEALVGDNFGLVDDVVHVEQPEWDQEDQDQDADKGSVDPDPGQGGSCGPEEHGPRTDD